jgi:hypothetical protein
MAILTTLLLVVSVLATFGFAQDREDAVRFEDDQVRVVRVSLLPGESRTIQDHQGGLLVYLTANLEGQLPRAEASWYSPGATTLENSATTRFEGIWVGLRAPASGVPAALPPEVAGQAESYGRLLAYSPYGRTPNRVRTLVDNDQVLVSLHRLARSWLPTEPHHFHPREVVLVYLAGGQISGSTGYLGTRHARRGDFDLLPANLVHAFRNMGNDPIEFVMIAPK